MRLIHKYHKIVIVVTFFVFIFLGGSVVRADNGWQASAGFKCFSTLAQCTAVSNACFECNSACHDGTNCIVVAATPTPGGATPTPNNGTPTPGGTPQEGAGSHSYNSEYALQAYGPRSFPELIGTILTWVFNIAIPIAVIMIIYSGLTILTSQGDSGKVKKGQDMLKYAVIGLAIIFIGKGFISLIQSILTLVQ